MSEGEWTKRLQAARGYAGWSTDQVAKELGISDSTYKRIEANRQHYNSAKRETFLARMAKITRVPETFFEYGWQSGEPTGDERLEAVEHQLAALRADLKEAKAEAAKGIGALSVTVARHTRAIAELRAAHRRRPPGAGSA